MSEIDWSKVPEGRDFAFTTGPSWSGSRNKAGSVEFALDESGYMGGAVHLLLGPSEWVLIAERPSQPEWRGPEDGLPPVGTVCEYQSDARSWQAGDRVEVLAHRRAKVESVAVVWNLRTKQARGVIAGVLRPLKSDKERAVDAALKVYDGTDGVLNGLRDLYDAGLLRLPEEQS